jgi:hypothetical protein
MEAPRLVSAVRAPDNFAARGPGGTLEHVQRAQGLPSARLPPWLLAAALAVAGGCGGGHGGEAEPDAAAPDAATPCEETECGGECVDLDTAHQHCGACFNACTPAQECQADPGPSACECPEINIMEGARILASMDSTTLAPAHLGIGAYSDGDAIQAVVIGFDLDTLLDTELDLAAVEAGELPFVGLGFQVNIATREPRSVYRAHAGTLTLTRRCAAGVAGTITAAALIEVDAATTRPLIDGCTATIPELAFDYGTSCPE